ncbi:heavy metal translocating P-type ATPase [Clostridium algidicarnis]|uniref:Cd(2+)-exporting ATPase n=1 Tax=Clostridium algidicarnis TaxID=37659 RepID=A0ABS6C4F8_9CLOT|nr:cation-translocating P-type ATPase [Clostridium algidicarnis]MBU3220363.1 cation-translocating P-type ATPase [Clostridium algidicarnis]
MLKRISELLSGFKMTIISGVFLVISLTLLLTGNKLPIDPAWITVIISGFPLLYSAITRLIYQKWISSALLISIAMIASISIGELFAAGEVAFIMAIGGILEERTIARAKKGLSKLIELAPVEGRKLVQKDGNLIEEIIPADQIKVGDLLRVLPGETIPVDGKIVSGNTSVDQSIMTGESLPIDKSVGEKVFCATMNCFGSIDMEATNVGEDSSLQKLINMVKEAENKKAPMQRIVDKWAVWLVPIALLIAIITFFATWRLGGDIMVALNRAVTVLIVFCPCALALATPTSIMAAIGQATKHGVIIKSGEALEKMGNVDTIAFDKTGTLTYGKLEVSDIISFNKDIKKIELLAISASAEAKSEHPLGKAIVSYAKEKNLTLTETTDFKMIAGMGIFAEVDGRNIYCGSEKFLLSNGITIHETINNTLEKLRKEGKASILVAEDGDCIGVIALSDMLRPTAKEMVKKLSDMGTQTVLLTGDNRMTADYFAKQVGITSVRAELLPEQKVSNITLLQNEGKNVCMIGDGVNDAPALKTANVGVAMGSMGSDIAVEAADIALMGDDISKIPYLKRLSRSTINTIKGNIIASMIINAVAVIMSVLGLLNPITGALVHNVGSVLVVLNAALLYDRNFDK